jgi:hypothetical protein
MLNSEISLTNHMLINIGHTPTTKSFKIRALSISTLNTTNTGCINMETSVTSRMFPLHETMKVNKKFQRELIQSNFLLQRLPVTNIVLLPH